MQKRELLRKKRQFRLRRKLMGRAEQPRFSVYRSNDHIYAQIIDDERGVTLVSLSSLDKRAYEQLAKKRGLEKAHEIGKMIAAQATTQGIEKVVFDRGGYRYHGRVKALADGAREGGLKF